MQTMIEISEQEFAQLNLLSESRQVSPADILHDAVRKYLGEQGKDKLDEFFGIWADRDIDGLEYQLKIRAEWDHRP